nr:ABC transporter substrate-binding protein [uncultured Mediterraneibacter sp.]
MKKRLLTFLAASALAVSMLSGCRNSENDTADAGNAAADAETITVTDARGEVEIPADPQRIVDLSGNSDILSILGYSVVGTANSDAYDYTKFPSYLEDTLKGATILGYRMQDTMDIEGILELDPDLIIISSVQEKMYDQLQEVAPTIMVELAQINWKDDIHTFAEILNKTDAADEWLADYEKKAAETGAQIRETYGENTTYLALLASGGQLYVFDAAGIGSAMYEDMGLAKPNNMPEQDNISLPVINYEGLADLDPDYLFVVGTDTDMESLRQNSVYNSMRAVADGNVIELPSSPYFNMGYSCIGRDVFLDEFASLMEK